MITLYIGIHNGTKERAPDFKHEVVDQIDLEEKQALLLVRALKGVAKYLTQGTL